MNNFIFVSFLFVSAAAFSQPEVMANEIQIERQINESLDNLAHLDFEKNQLEQGINDLETKLREKKKIINKRGRALAYLRSFQWGGLLSVEEPYEIERNLKVIDRLNKYDLELFKEYKTTIKSLAIARQNLTETKKQLQTMISNLQLQQTRLTESDTMRREQLVVDKKSSLLTFKGQLARPLVGSLLLPYGSRPDKQNQYVFISKGQLIKSLPQQAVHSVGPGVVIFRDHLPHWRETLIVQHDDNYFSVYAGLSPGGTEQKKLNEKVEKNEVIGVANDEEFYFELRHFENPINPEFWFKESL
ncbi:MAG: peptidoglycan DD-metalloendopeptidase family protein [Bdellovibrionaceae bacterium]|nr:peptidoglycan DD-metalloendopeptidase family protein [Bdellovibrio sp.]